MVARTCPSGHESGPKPEPPEVLSVALGQDEEVRWIWTHTVGGGSVVTGYTIVRKEDEGRLEA